MFKIMLKRLLLVAMAILSIHMVNAQVVVDRANAEETTSKKSVKNDDVSTFAIKFGVKAGANMTTISNNMDFDPGLKMGSSFCVGAVANLRWGQRTENSLPGTGLFGLQPELIYSIQNVGTDDENISLQTIQLPIMVKYYPTTELSFEVGPQFSYILSSSPDELVVGGTRVKTGDIQGLNVGVGAGVAYDFSFGLIVGARYTYNFNDLAKNLEWTTSNIQVTVGWLF